MTRDEAVKIAKKAKEKWGGGSSEYWLVIALEALGVLKLEPERSGPEALLCDVLYSAGLRGIQQRAVIDGITSAGLKLIHRSPQEIGEPSDG